MISSVASSLGIGSGIDTKALVSELAANARGSREQVIKAKEQANAARITATATLRNGLEALVNDYADGAQGVLIADLGKLARSFVAGFNLLRTSTTDIMKAGTASTAAGPLSGDAAARGLAGELSRLPQTELATSGSLRTLSDIGIGVSRTGTLSLDMAKLNAAVAADPAQVSALLVAPTGLSSALAGIRDRVLAPGGAFNAAAARYTRIGSTIAKERERMIADNDRLVARLTRSFGGMDRQVAALKAVQSYVEQQVAAWNSR